MSEEAGFSLRAGLDVITNPTQLKNLYENDLFVPANLVAAISNHDFGVVVFRAQFYPPPVLAAVYEAYYPAETIPMNGFTYEIWRPGPRQEERAAFALSLETLAPGETATQTLALSIDQAGGWLAHALAFHNWEPVSGLAGDGDCLSGTYRKAPITLAARVCAAEPGAELTLAGSAE
jgi:hypothetical protein